VNLSPTTTTSVPFGFCHCGCGKQTSLAICNNKTLGYAKNQPHRFLPGHAGGINSAKARLKRFRTTHSGTFQRFCTSCQKWKSYTSENYNTSLGGKRTSHCRSCKRISSNKIYHRNPIPYKKRAKIIRDKNRIQLRQRAERIKLQYGCRACPEKEPACLDFHHLHPAKKDYPVARCSTVTKFEKEIVKCAVLCCNCHRKTHAKIISVPDEWRCSPNDGKIY